MSSTFSDMEQQILEILRTDLIKTLHASKTLSESLQGIKEKRGSSKSRYSSREDIGNVLLEVSLNSSEGNRKRSLLGLFRKEEYHTGEVSFVPLDAHKDVKEDARIDIHEPLVMRLAEQSLQDQLEQRYKQDFKEKLGMSVQVLYHPFGDESN